MSELLKLNVSDYVEKKNGLSYLSWAHAWAEVLKLDPQATWEAVEFNGLPVAILPDESAMVKVLVTIKGHTKSCWLPVMNHRNQAIKGPDAFAINTAIVRCLTKAISMHGLGLYIYAGEDLPEQDKQNQPEPKKSGAALAGIGDELGQEKIEWLKDVAAFLIEQFNDEGAEAALATYKSYDLDETEALYVQSCIKDSKTRKALGFVWVKAA